MGTIRLIASLTREQLQKLSQLLIEFPSPIEIWDPVLQVVPPEKGDTLTISIGEGGISPEFADHPRLLVDLLHLGYNFLSSMQGTMSKEYHELSTISLTEQGLVGQTNLGDSIYLLPLGQENKEGGKTLYLDEAKLLTELAPLLGIKSFIPILNKKE